PLSLQWRDGVAPAHHPAIAEPQPTARLHNDERYSPGCDLSAPDVDRDDVGYAHRSADVASGGSFGGCPRCPRGHSASVAPARPAELCAVLRGPRFISTACARGTCGTPGGSAGTAACDCPAPRLSGVRRTRVARPR